MKLLSSWRGRAICLALIVLLSALLVMHGFPRQTPQQASAEGLGSSILIAAIVEFLGGFYDVGLDKLCEWLSKDDPNYQSQIDQIKQSLSQVDQEYQDCTQALNDVSTVIKQMMSYEEQVHLQTSIENINTAWDDSYKQNIWGPGANPTQQQISDFCAGVMSTFNLESAVRKISDYMSHTNEPRGVLDTYTDYLIDSPSSLGATEDFSTRVQTTDGSKVVVERPTYFDYQGWNGGHDVMGAAEPATKFYFAEGTSRPGFDTYLCLQDPGDKAARVMLTYMLGDGTTRHQNVTVSPFSRMTVRPADVVGIGDGVQFDFSTEVVSTNGVGIIAERPMYFDYNGVMTGGHDTVGLGAPAGDFYFAEGTSRPGFDTYVCVQNPADKATHVKATFMKGDGTQTAREFDVAAHSRYTLRAEEAVGRGDGDAYDYSVKVSATDGGKIVAERPIYFDYHGWTGGTDVMGSTATAGDFYFAEGTCRPGFDPYICLQNPGSEKASAVLTYMKGDGTTADQAIAVPPHSRATVSPRDVLGSADDAAHDFSTRVQSVGGQGLVAERPMYFNYKGNWTGGSDVVGALAPRGTWYFAEGSIRKGFIPYFCIQNPQSTPSRVRLTYMGTDGQQINKDVTVAAHSRKTVVASDDLSVLMSSYCGLEQYFSQLVHEQVFGADMVLEAKNFDPLTYGSPDDYLSQTLQPMISSEADCFRDNVQRLVMSQSTLVNDPNNNTISLGADGEAVLDRASFIIQQLKHKALNDDTPMLSGTTVATQDLIPAGGTMALKARNKASGETQDASTTTVLPQYATEMAEPFNATNWKVAGMKDFYYDQWSDAASPVVTPNNDLSIICYEFTDNIAPGYYDILDSNGNVVVPGVQVYQYDDSMNVSNTGDNVEGNFTLLERGNAGGQRMMSDWADVNVTTTPNAWIGSDYNTGALTPKHLSGDLYSTSDAGKDREFQQYGKRAFTYSGPDNQQGWLMAQYSTTGDPQFNTKYGVTGLHLHQSAAGDYAGAWYKITIMDLTANSETTLINPSWKLTCDAGSASKSIDDSWTNYCQPSGTSPPKIPMAYTFMNGHDYEVRFYIDVNGKGIGIADAYATMDMTLNTTYLMFSN